MHRRTLNTMSLGVEIRPRGPILVQGTDEVSDPSRPDLAFIRTRHPDAGETIFLPGTGLKGAIRAHAEASLRGLGVTICDPFAGKDGANHCSGAQGDTPAVYRAQCPACRTFGSLALAGRVDLADAMPWPVGADPRAHRHAIEQANATEIRPHVAIDRRTASASTGALYESEVAVAGAFFTEVRLRNVELWQLGLLVAVLRELDAGFFGLGHGKARGQGQVSAKVTGLAVEMARHDLGTRRLLGVASYFPEAEERGAYGLVDPADDAIDLPESTRVERTWNGHRVEIAAGHALDALLDRVVDGPLAARFAVDLDEEVG